MKNLLPTLVLMLLSATFVFAFSTPSQAQSIQPGQMIDITKPVVDGYISRRTGDFVVGVHDGVKGTYSLINRNGYPCFIGYVIDNPYCVGDGGCNQDTTHRNQGMIKVISSSPSQPGSWMVHFTQVISMGDSYSGDMDFCYTGDYTASTQTLQNLLYTQGNTH